jgi:adenylosuccinate lyase
VIPMIDRYSRDAMKKIWTETARFDAFLKVEILATEAHANLGIVPKADYEKIAANARYDIQRVKDLETITKHDVIAFTRTVSESLGEERKWLHYGLTSTDVVDTAQAYLIRQANDIIENGINKMLGVLKAKALAYEFTPCIGRTHGVHADVTSFGLKWARWYDELKRDLKRFKEARTEIETGKISGAVGNFANTPPYVEEFVCTRLGLNFAPISTQVLSRDLHAHYLMVLALIASMLEKMATEIRQLSRTEIHEVEEYFSENQKGSSAMPHKRNPITSENICGCARVMKSYVSVGLENNILWHERDISHSSAERIVLADATTLIDYMLNRYADTLNKLTVFPEQMKANIYLTNGIIFFRKNHDGHD